MMALVGVSISGMPGPPLGPSKRITTTIPAQRSRHEGVHTVAAYRSFPLLLHYQQLPTIIKTMLDLTSKQNKAKQLLVLQPQPGL